MLLETKTDVFRDRMVEKGVNGMIAYKKENLIESSKAGCTKLLGNTKKRMDAFFDKRIFSDFAKKFLFLCHFTSFLHSSRAPNTLMRALRSR